jgi:hypothetical protein
MVVERPVELEAIGQHDHRLRASLAFIHREPDRLGSVREQAAAEAPGVLDHPATGVIPRHDRLSAGAALMSC